MHHLFTLRTFCTAQMLFINDLQDSWRIPHKATAYISCFAIHKPFTFSKNMFICIVRTPITPMFVSQVNIVLKTGNIYWRHVVQQRSCSLHCYPNSLPRDTKGSGCKEKNPTRSKTGRLQRVRLLFETTGYNVARARTTNDSLWEKYA